eukprot:m.32432 g.32432  ORF g.32432 m.32432 type:complete len:74 (+) comp6384_c0_seq1:1672-1893(+)
MTHRNQIALLGRIFETVHATESSASFQVKDSIQIHIQRQNRPSFSTRTTKTKNKPISDFVKGSFTSIDGVATI